MILTFFLGLVSKHGTESDITDALDVVHAGVELVIDNDSALLVYLNTNCFKVESLGHWTATNSNQENVGIELEANVI